MLSVAFLLVYGYVIWIVSVYNYVYELGKYYLNYKLLKVDVVLFMMSHSQIMYKTAHFIFAHSHG